MQALIVLAVTFVLLWVVAGLEEGEEVVLTAGIHGRITELGAEDLLLEVAPGVELRVARQAVLRRVEHVDADVQPPAAGEAATNGDSAVGGPPRDDAQRAGTDVATPTDPT
jgi:preprotein translocase subunit YajC